LSKRSICNPNGVVVCGVKNRALTWSGKVRTVRIFPVIMAIREGFNLRIGPRSKVPVNGFWCTRESFAALRAASPCIGAMAIKDLGAAFTFELVFVLRVDGVLGSELSLKFSAACWHEKRGWFLEFRREKGRNCDIGFFLPRNLFSLLLLLSPDRRKALWFRDRPTVGYARPRGAPA